jgi:hypothetical protein
MESGRKELAMATRTLTVDLDAELAERLERSVPPPERNAFVQRALREQLDALGRGQLQAEMEECAREMFDEILTLEKEFHPLEEELHRRA